MKILLGKYFTLFIIHWDMRIYAGKGAVGPPAPDAKGTALLFLLLPPGYLLMKNFFVLFIIAI
jgi:hypothetical protein